jgi:hypothetical protein
MGWYCHPDTLTIARAQGIADRTGHEKGSLEWRRAYRDAYERAAGGSYPDSLARYLAALDEGIAELEAQRGSITHAR